MRKVLLRVVAIVLSICLVASGRGSAVSIIPLASDINLCGIVDSDGADRTGWQTVAASWLSNIQNLSVSTYSAFTATQLGNYLKGSKIFVVHTHGSQDLLKAVDADGNVTYLQRSDMEQWANGRLDSVQLAFFAACKTGKGASAENNLVNSAYALGADCVIGYTVSVHTRANYIMIEEFCKAIGAGYTIEEALVYADTKVLERYGGSTGQTQYRYILGDTSARFTDQIYNIGSAPGDATTMSISGSVVSNYLNLDKIHVANNVNGIEINSMNVSASDYLHSICDDASRYTLTQCYYSEDTAITTYIYTYKIAGIDTGDYVYIMLNANNDIVAWGNPNEGVYDGITLTEDDLQYTATELHGIVTALGCEEYSICEERILWNNGVLTVRYSVELEANDGTVSVEDFYVAIPQEVE